MDAQFVSALKNPALDHRQQPRGRHVRVAPDDDGLLRAARALQHGRDQQRAVAVGDE